MFRQQSRIWRKKLPILALLVVLNNVSATFSDIHINPNDTSTTTYYESRSRTSDGQIQILYANKSDANPSPFYNNNQQNQNVTRQSDQVMILGKSRITIPKDKTQDWPGVKIVTGDSYLKALEYSQNIRNAQGGAVEINSKSTQLIRREFNPSPIYKPENNNNNNNKNYYNNNNKERDNRANPQIHSRVLYAGPTNLRDDFAPPVQPAANFNAPTSATYNAPSSSFVPMQPDSQMENYPTVQGSYDGFTGHDVYGPPIYEDSYKPQNPSTVYGYPQQAYGPPQTYGPPPSNYGNSMQTYGNPPQNYGSPYSFDMLSSIGISWPFIKLNAGTIAKILLKLVIFKLIVKFIGLVCLLLFIPKLDMKKGTHNNETETDNEERSLNDYSTGNKYLDEITTQVFTALENFEKNMAEDQNERNESCSSIWCIFQKSFFFEKDEPKETKSD